jgi:cytochrome P450
MPRAALPPGPPGRLLGGHIHEFGNFLAFLPRCAAFGDISCFRFGPRRIVLVNHPDLIERVLVLDARLYRKHTGQRLIQTLLGDGLVTSEGDFWLRQRRLAQPPFLKQRVAVYAPVIIGEAERHIADWRPGEVRDLHAEMAALAGKVAMTVLFGTQPDADRHALSAAMAEVTEIVEARFRRLVHLPGWVPTAENRRLRQALADLDAVVFRIVRAGRGRSPGADLLSVLLHARAEDGSAMTERQLRDEIVTLYFAAADTSALILTWAWHLLAVHPGAEDRLAAEWRAVLGGRPPTAEDAPHLPFTEWVVLETLRQRPPVYVIGREAAEPVELGGYALRRGQTVLMSQWVTHRDARWFADPEAFRPERWQNGLAARLPKYAFYPFGGGPRLCLGNAFALLEAALLLATIGQRFRFSLAPGHQVEPTPSTTLRPRAGVWAVLAAR